jgi:AI-2 transport protein TqsA
MKVDRSVRASLVVSAGVLGLAALHYFEPILAPVTFAVLIIAMVWPVQRRLQALMPQLAAVALTMLATLVAAGSTAYLAAWGISGIVRWVNQNASHLQGLYARVAEWLEGRGLDSAGILSEQFSISTVLRLAREVAASLQGMSSFLLLTLVFVILGLLEVDDLVRRVRVVSAGDDGRRLLGTGRAIALKLQKYMGVRGLMSIVTGLAVWGYTAFMGLDLAMEWGVLAFVLNFIPFIGSFVATILPSVLALMQYESVQTALLAFLGLNAIQFLVGSYLEPRLAGAAVSISPFMVLFAVFFFGSLWGFFGAFIGVPLLIAAATLLEQHDSTRWIATLVTGPPRPGTAPPSGPR